MHLGTLRTSIETPPSGWSGARAVCRSSAPYDTVKSLLPRRSSVPVSDPAGDSEAVGLPRDPAPRISVIIPSWNEASTLPGLLETLRHQTVSDFEIILADSGSTDATAEVAASFGIRVSPGRRMGPAEGRNRGARLARSDILVFMDADCLVPPVLLEQVVKALGDLTVIGGATLFRPLEGTAPERLLFFLANAYQRATIAWGWPHNAGFCFFFRRSAFDQLGGMREDMLLNETHDVALRSRNLGRFVSLPVAVETSVRRFRRNGFMKTVLHEYLGSTILYYLTKQSPATVFRPEPVR